MNDIVRSRSDVTIIILVFVALAIIGIVAGGFIVRDYARARASLNWPVADGVVLSQLDGDRAPVRYVYSFEGRSYESRRIRVFSARFLKAAPRDYAPGEAVRVYVNPDNPSFSVLRPGGAGLAFVVFCAFSGLCIFIGVGGVVWTFSDGVEALEASLRVDGDARAPSA
jgi:hypothetical protein